MDSQLISYMWVFGAATLMLLYMVYQRIQSGIQKAIVQKIEIVDEWQKINLEFSASLKNQGSAYNLTPDFLKKVNDMPDRLSRICTNLLNRPSRVTITLYENPDWDVLIRDLNAGQGWRIMFRRNEYRYEYAHDLPTMSVLAGAKFYLINDLANPVTERRRWRFAEKNNTGTGAVYGSLLCLPLHRSDNQFDILGFLHIYASGTNAFDPLVDVKVLKTLASDLSQTIGMVSSIISANRSADRE